eukprot:73394-Chlamydomonas_euryale.AAC.1
MAFAKQRDVWVRLRVLDRMVWTGWCGLDVVDGMFVRHWTGCCGPERLFAPEGQHVQNWRR